MSGGLVGPIGESASSFTRCPNCGTELAEDDYIAGRAKPAAEVVSICRGCAEIVTLTRRDSGLGLRAATASEYLSLSPEAQNLLRVAHLLVSEQIKRRVC